MLIEFGVSAFSAWAAHSAAILAFSSDSLVEVLSATVVPLQFAPVFAISERKAVRASGVLLFVLAFVVPGMAVLSLAMRIHAEVSRAGIGITIAALFAMPKLKRREAGRSNNLALAADAVQSAAWFLNGRSRTARIELKNQSLNLLTYCCLRRKLLRTEG
jgi:hypothetical protein